MYLIDAATGLTVVNGRKVHKVFIYLLLHRKGITGRLILFTSIFWFPHIWINLCAAMNSIIHLSYTPHHVSCQQRKCTYLYVFTLY